MKITFNDQSLEIVDGSCAKDVVQKLGLHAPNQSLGAYINNSLKDLSTKLVEGDVLSFLDFEDPKGKELFWHTSAHVLAQAILRIWPDAMPTIGPPIENGFYYDFANLTITEEDFEKIEAEVQKILNENFATIRYEFKDKEEALERFKSNPYKVELINSFEEGPLTGYGQGEFFDLCRGPHLSNLGKIKAFKILKTSGAYWKADSSREMLTRIYAISFPDRKLLKEYLTILEEAKKRDHKILGPKLDLFSLQEASPGIPLLHPKGMVVWNKLIDFLRTLLMGSGYVEIKTPLLMGQELWERSGHWDYYRDNMYHFQVETRNFAIKPMNCPGCMLYYKTALHSYRELPLRVAEIGHVHRYEASGALNGLFRVRSFHQDDAHLFMRPCDIKSEILGILTLVEKIYATFGLHYFLELSTRPLKSTGSDADWEVCTNGLKDALDAWGRPFRINEGDGAFYGPKIDIHIKDALGRSWQCGTIQLDMALPEKFELEYIDTDGAHKRPIMLHRAIFGSVERFFGILIENFSGRFPLWISPLQVRIITVADRHAEYGQKVLRALKEMGLNCDIDDTQESVNKKIRKAQLLQINYMLAIGDKEMENNTVSVRTRENVVHGEIDLDSFISALKEEIEEKSLSSNFKGTAS